MSQPCHEASAEGEGFEGLAAELAAAGAMLDRYDAPTNDEGDGGGPLSLAGRIEAMVYRDAIRAPETASAGGPSSAAGDLIAPYVPVAIHLEEADTLDFVERDVPTVARSIYAGLDVLLDAATREPIGWRVYGWSRIAPPGGWRPIETAPRDGFVLLYTPASYEMAGFVAMAKWQSGSWYGVDEDGLTFNPLQAWDRVTHWQPLPNPPKADSQEGNGPSVAESGSTASPKSESLEGH